MGLTPIRSATSATSASPQMIAPSSMNATAHAPDAAPMITRSRPGELVLELGHIVGTADCDETVIRP